LVVAVLSGVADGLVVDLAAPTISWRALSIAMVVLGAKAFNLFLKQHPVEEVTDGTVLVTKAAAAAGEANLAKREGDV
jgi:hypothetical protein